MYSRKRQDVVVSGETNGRYEGSQSKKKQYGYSFVQHNQSDLN